MKLGTFKSTLLGSATLAAMLIGGINSAQATPTLTLGYSTTSGTGSIVDIGTCAATGASTCTGSYTASFAGGDTMSGSLTAGGNFFSYPFGTTNYNVSSTIAAKTSATVYLWATLTGITGSPTGGLPFNVLSSMTSNLLPAGWTATMATYYDTSGAMYGTADPLASNSFSSEGTYKQINTINSLGNPWSLTEMIAITANTNSSALSTITMKAVPEPSNLGMMGLGLMVIGLMGLKMRQKKYRSKSLEA